MKWNIAQIRNIFIASAVVLLISCGGEEAPGPNPTTPTTGAAGLAALEVTVTKPTLETKADQTTVVTITAVDSNRRALADVPVSLSASSGILSGQSDATDSNGRMTANFGLGADRGNRDVTITATSGAVVGAAGISVAGTTLALSASPPTATNATTPVEVAASIVDAGSVPLGGVVVNFVTTGGTLSSAVASTNAAGVAKVALTGVTADVTVTAVGANASAAVQVKAGSTALPNPEPAGVLIKDLTIQANPSVVGPNAGTAETNFSQIDVRVTGDLGAAVGIPVTNAPVRIRIASSPPFGRLSVDTSAAPVLSNSAGTVSARFIAGGSTTGTDQIVVCASIDGVAMLPGGGAPCNANEKAVKLTISQQPLFVRISFNNEIGKIQNNQLYEKLFTIYLTDAAGKGVSGVPVSVRLLPLYYFKGRMAYVQDPGPPQFTGWAFVPPITQCDNEDKNFNGIVDTGDTDTNNDGILWPGQSAAFSLDNNGVTDSSGFVTLRVKYGQRFAFWATYQIEARASTGGSERSTTIDYTLSAAKEDVTSDTTPGFARSPFGIANMCSNPN